MENFKNLKGKKKHTTTFVKYILIWFADFHTHIQYITHDLNGSAFLTAFESYQKPLIFTAEN